MLLLFDTMQTFMFLNDCIQDITTYKWHHNICPCILLIITQNARHIASCHLLKENRRVVFNGDMLISGIKTLWPSVSPVMTSKSKQSLYILCTIDLIPYKSPLGAYTGEIFWCIIPTTLKQNRSHAGSHQAIIMLFLHLWKHCIRYHHE